MKKIIALLLFISGVALGQSTTQPQRAMYGNTTEIQSYPGLAGVFIRYNFNSRTFGVYAKDATDTTSPASDSVIVSTTGVRFKLLTDEAGSGGGGGGSVAWGDITGKPSTFTPASHNQAISTVTGLQDSLNTRQTTIVAGTSLQYYRGDKTWATLDKSAVGLGSVQNVDQTNASNLTSGTIPAGRYGALTVPMSAMNASGTAGSGTFLRGDGVWAAPSSSAVTSVAGRTGTVTLTMSDISGLGTAATFNVPASGNASTTEVVRGNDTRLTGLTANLAAKSDTSHRHSAAHLTSGTIPAARYGTGTIPVLALNATGSTADTAVLRRNGTWAVISGGGGSSGLSDPGSNGILSRTASGTTTARTLSVSGDGLSVTNGTGVSGNPTYSLANDVAAIEALTGTGFPKRTGSDTWAISAVDLSGAEATGTMAAARMPALTGDVTSSAGGVATTYNNVVPASKGGAGTVSGLMKANGSGTVSAAVAGTDYVVPSGNISGTAANVSGTVAVANGGTGATTAANARTNLGATTIGGNMFTLTNPSAVTFPRFNADNTITALSAATFLSAIAGAPLSSPTFTGTPAAPTATAGTNTTQIATTAFVYSATLPKVSYKTITEIRAFTATDVTNMPTVFVTDSGKEGVFKYVAGSGNSDNTGTVLVTTTGSYRYERVFSGAVLPEWFGAVGDGSTYDTTPIQNALNYAAANGVGMVVQLSGKNYKVTTLTMPDSVKLVGLNAKLTQVRANGTAIPVITCGNKNEVDGITIICNPVNNTFDNNGAIAIVNKTNVTVKNCYIKNHGIFGVMVDRSKNVNVVNNRFWTNNQMADIGSPSGVWTNSSDIMLYSGSSLSNQNVLISQNKCNSPFTSQGIWVNALGYDKDIIVNANNCVTTNEDGSDWTSTNYWLEDGSGSIRRHGIEISYLSTANSGGIVVSNNICRKTTMTGIYISGGGLGEGVIVSNNYCAENGYTNSSNLSLAAGIFVGAGTGSVLLEGNQIVDFQCTSTAAGAINIQRNTDSANPHNIKIYNNTILNSLGVGYRIQNSSDNVVIDGGSITNTAKYDIYYDNNITTATINNWLTISNLSIIRGNLSYRSMWLDAVNPKKISLTNIVSKGIDATTNNSENYAVFIDNPTNTTLKITNCVFEDYYIPIVFEEELQGRRKDIIISDNYFKNCWAAVYADNISFPYTAYIIGTNNRYEYNDRLTHISYNKVFYEGKMSYDGTIEISVDDLSISTGSWTRGDRIQSLLPSSGAAYLKTCTVSGTFGTLSGVTGSITSGTKTLTVNSATNLRVGMYINIAGVSGTKKITSVVGTTITIDSNANATVSSAAVSYQAPTLLTVSTLP